MAHLADQFARQVVPILDRLVVDLIHFFLPCAQAFDGTTARLLQRRSGLIVLHQRLDLGARLANRCHAVDELVDQIYEKTEPPELKPSGSKPHRLTLNLDQLM
jgi:hypothetical protein